jgi:hypothetical protein
MMLDGGHGMISSALKTIRARWDNVEPHWQDLLRQQFVEQVWEPLQEDTRKVLEAADRLQVLLSQMRRECEGNSVDIYTGD